MPQGLETQKYNNFGVDTVAQSHSVKTQIFGRNACLLSESEASLMSVLVLHGVIKIHPSESINSSTYRLILGFLPYCI